MGLSGEKDRLKGTREGKGDLYCSTHTHAIVLDLGYAYKPLCHMNVPIGAGIK